MLKYILVACSLGLLLACNDESGSVDNEREDSVTTKEVSMNNTLTEDEKKEGWQLLFDGVSTSGWHKYGNSPVGAAWKVTEGTLFLDPAEKAGGDIVTDNEYDNFELSLEWKVDTSGNSGIIFYIHEDSSKYEWSWNTGLEMQVLDNNGHPDAKIIKHRAGDLYDLISCSKETVKPALEWNKAGIKSVNGKLDLFLNGENVVSTTLWDDNWKKLVAGSKFKTMPDFGTYKKGKIGLQDHGNKVWFRNIRIKKL
ncbi:MAG TPA: DUF1080 domain-containing protein [Chitinophagaceae bacterium]|nr:DUF1080 domain-containing protein [Chitinophagaceae bacterium]